MSRRTHACIACNGRTRHDNQVCAGCRRSGITSDGSQVSVRLTLVTPAHPEAPTRDELDNGVDLTAMLAWPGTDSHSPTIPGRYA